MTNLHTATSTRNSRPSGTCLLRLKQFSVLLLTLLAIDAVQAEPYLAIRTGQKCMACHVNPAGGGKRTKFGRIYGQTILPSKSSTDLLIDDVNKYLDMGADLRSSMSYDKLVEADDQLAFTTDRATLYVEARLVPQRVTFYLDERFAPGASNREAWLMYQTSDRKSFLKAGNFYLPYGLRIEDDTAFIREATGVSFNNADNGIMLGHDAGPWSARVSLTNGTNGGAETNTAKQISARAAYIKHTWRVGASANSNDATDSVSRNMFNVFGGLQHFGIDWLAEIDWISDASPDFDRRNQYLGFLEANKEIVKGQNLKATIEWLDPDFDISENQQTRTSLVWEYTPLPLIQLRVGARMRDGIPQNPAQNTDSVFAQLHVWF